MGITQMMFMSEKYISEIRKKRKLVDNTEEITTLKSRQKYKRTGKVEDLRLIRNKQYDACKITESLLMKQDHIEFTLER